MSLRDEPGAMTQYHREYARRRNLPATERAAIDSAIAKAEKGKCTCNSCKVLRAIGTLRAATSSYEEERLT